MLESRITLADGAHKIVDNVVVAHGAAGGLLNILILLLLTSAILIVGIRTAERAIALLVLQSTILAAIATVVAVVSGTAEIYVSVVATLAVKAVLVPFMLFRVLRRVGSVETARMYLGARNATVVALGLVLLAYALISPTAIAGTLITGSYFPTSVALILVGGLVMVVRRKALIQVIGLIVIENGVYVASMATTHGLPPVVELGIAFDLFVTVLLLATLALRIGVSSETLDTSALRRLRG
ncbi:MAG: energy-converting Ni,Fe-hydrogenase subunit HyfE [Chloroflexi bacterium]|nr:energy-converting Ni,Fe-hydrogenase subunit HyfE [Chloroflexota bacterium]